MNVNLAFMEMMGGKPKLLNRLSTLETENMLEMVQRHELQSEEDEDESEQSNNEE